MKNMKKIAFLAVCMLFALQSVLGACAFEASYDSDGCVLWERSADRQTLSGDKQYTLYKEPYEVSVDFYVHAKTVYRYENGPSWVYDGTEYFGAVSSPHADADFVWVKSASTIYLYTATDEARGRLDDFFNGVNSVYRLEKDNSGDEGYLTEETVGAILAAAEAGSGATEKDVRELSTYGMRYKIKVYDATESLTYTYGMVYRIDGKYYYVHYPALGNEHFDAGGNFSYRSGTVTLYELDAKTGEEIANAAATAEYIWTNYDYEEDGDDFSLADPEVDDDVFWATYVFVGFVLPALLLILGVLLPQVKKLGKPKYWYVLSGIAAVWLILATAFTLIIL